MSSEGGKFTREERMYLESLPVVNKVTETRIMYADSFKRDCLQRYLDGESPSRLFSEAGLSPKLIGYKRIERAFNRWKANKDKILGDAPSPSPSRFPYIGPRYFNTVYDAVPDTPSAVPESSDPADPGTGEAGQAGTETSASARQSTVYPSAPSSPSVPSPSSSVRSSVPPRIPIPHVSDTRDILILQQIHRIMELENHISALEAEIDSLRAQLVAR